MSTPSITDMRNAHKVLAEFTFEPKELNRGYADRTLRIDVGKNEIETRPVTQQMKDLWIGGKGFDMWLMFQEINKDTDWDSPENTIAMSAGPLGGITSFPGSGKTLVTSISPLTHMIIDSNVGGYFGPYLKFTGFDAIAITGKSDEEIIIIIDGVNHKITIESAPKESIDAHILCEDLTEMYADNEADMRNIAVVAAGRGADHTNFGILNFSFWDWRRGAARIKQAGRGGIGTVFRDKKIKAIVCKQQGITPGWSISDTKVIRPEIHDGPACDGCRSEEVKKIQEIIHKWNDDAEYVIEMMQDIQEEIRYISKIAVDEINKITLVPKSQLYHIATFYKTFSLKPKGETIIQVCTGTACHVKGSAKILDQFKDELGIGLGETTEDGKFTLEAVGCLGACSIAPVVKMGEEVHGNVMVSDVSKLVTEYKTKKGGE